MVDVNNLTIRVKFSIPLLIVGLLAVLVSVLSINSARSLSSDANLLSSTFMNAIDTGLNADRDLYQALTASQSYVTKRHLQLPGAEQDRKDFEENAKQALDRMNQVRSLVKDYPQIGAAMGNFDKDYQTWLDEANKVFSLSDAGKTQEAAEHNSTQVMTKFAQLREHYDVMGGMVKELADDIATSAQQANATQRNIMLMVILLVILASAVSILFGPKLVTNRVAELNRMIATISEGEGDLRGRLDSSGKDELSQLAGTFNGLMQKLQDLIKMIKGDAETLDIAVNKLNQSADESHNISGEQNSNLDQIATAVNELSHAVHEVASNSQTALAETREAKEKTSQSGLVVDESVASISKLSGSVSHASSVISKLAEESKNIAQVLDVIRGIAEQTNLLALNAAIEAARAGEQGRGFAVVADEVRTLASRTQQSTADIQRMIAGLENGVSEAVSAMNAGTSEVDGVVEMSQRIQTSLNTVEHAVNQTNDMIYQIATATEEQSKVVDEINRNISMLNSLSQKNMAVVGNTKGVADEIASMAEGLNDNVGRFKV
ncbi:methyl-accepting chemotaxis protein [Bowmanella sp. Y26]|uniref:methyl-accepting chemotaxis protein n=1 Tax=Bowmanella yangjiangensis TaxID=2811230 RepID=UPI001BDC244B|nr:methyl-accepting chemotaxis protein [Bowmanella yangjiangensis]MBT1062937.1 methyl-accepting chemotaxis protein [Bowmanella yangjiangensis]